MEQSSWPTMTVIVGPALAADRLRLDWSTHGEQGAGHVEAELVRGGHGLLVFRIQFQRHGETRVLVQRYQRIILSQVGFLTLGC